VTDSPQTLEWHARSDYEAPPVIRRGLMTLRYARLAMTGFLAPTSAAADRLAGAGDGLIRYLVTANLCWPSNDPPAVAGPYL
jgi:hypothetical protein